MDMFCYQCEQTSKGQGCDRTGVCGKDPETAALQDLLIYAIKGISQYAHRARGLGAGLFAAALAGCGLGLAWLAERRRGV